MATPGAGITVRTIMNAVIVAQSAGNEIRLVTAHQWVNGTQSAAYPFPARADSTFLMTADIAGRSQVQLQHFPTLVRHENILPA